MYWNIQILQFLICFLVSTLGVLFSSMLSDKKKIGEICKKNRLLYDSLILCNLRLLNIKGKNLTCPQSPSYGVEHGVWWESKVRCRPLLPNLTVGRWQCEGWGRLKVGLFLVQYEESSSPLFNPAKHKAFPTPFLLDLPDRQSATLREFHMGYSAVFTSHMVISLHGQIAPQTKFATPAIRVWLSGG